MKKKKIVRNNKIARVALLIVLDVFCVILAEFLALWLRFDMSIIRADFLDTYSRFLAIDAVIVVAIFAFYGLYTFIWKYASVPEMLSIAMAVATSDVAIFAYKHVLLLPSPRSFWFIFPALLMLFVGGVRFSRRIVKEIVRKINNHKRPDNIMIIGAGDAANKVIDEILHNAAYAQSRIACIIDDDINKNGSHIHDIPIVGTRNDIGRMVNKYLITEIIIAIPSAPRRTIATIINRCQKTGCEIKIVPNAFYSFGDTVDNLNEAIQPINYKRVRAEYGQKTFKQADVRRKGSAIIKVRKIAYLSIKRVFDVLIGAFCSIITIFIMIFVKLLYLANGDFAPILFKQKRIGKGGKVFDMYKIRTMIPNAQEKLQELLDSDPKLKKEYQINKKLKNDPRITKAGGVIRKMSIDEFPQFINVVMGQMSIVGNRPYLPGEKKEMNGYFDIITESKPGIISYWAINGRSDTSFKARLQLEEYYTMRRGLFFDFRIALAAIKVVLFSKGAK